MFEQAVILALNHLLRDAQWARERLAPLAGRTARMAMAPFAVEFAINRDGSVAVAASAQPDVVIKLPAHAPFQILGGMEALLRQARVSGSAEVADTLGFVLRNLHWDFEEDLSRVIGDVAAHRVAQGVHGLASWQAGAVRRGAENVAEYLREEQGSLTGRAAASGFAAAVDELRDDLARLEKRIERIELRSKQF
jgi:ubiquinone biosynthesis protein UbiJ